jgi:hypothetical protein
MLGFVVTFMHWVQDKVINLYISGVQVCYMSNFLV